ncbi:MAG: YbhB/YbcL family Raf kinase inhibitor-like protein, partial [Anaerolineales bacterium]
MKAPLRTSKTILVPIVIFLTLINGCSLASSPKQTSEVSMSIQLLSTSFKLGEMIPKKYTCDGADISPQISWKNIPTEAKSLALIMDDPDAPVGTFTHWVLFNIPINIHELTEGVKNIGVAGINDFRRIGYGGPCPPRGSNHRYYFKLYALDSMLPLKEGAKR